MWQFFVCFKTFYSQPNSVRLFVFRFAFRWTAEQFTLTNYFSSLLKMTFLKVSLSKISVPLGLYVGMRFLFPFKSSTLPWHTTWYWRNTGGSAASTSDRYWASATNVRPVSRIGFTLSLKFCFFNELQCLGWHSYEFPYCANTWTLCGSLVKSITNGKIIISEELLYQFLRFDAACTFQRFCYLCDAGSSFL